MSVVDNGLDRNALAEMLLSAGMTETDFEMEPDLSLLPANASLARDLAIPYPDDSLAPRPIKPDAAANTDDPLPKADVIVITWTVAEQNALADVLTPGFNRNTWKRYNRRFLQDYAPKIRPGAPSHKAERLGSWCLTKIGTKTVLCFKSELHLNQDGIFNGVAPGVATLPVKELFEQLIAEVDPEVVITVGTSGGLFEKHDLGDVAVTRAAKFRCKSEFKNAPFNQGQIFKSIWDIPRTHFADAIDLMQGFADNLKEGVIPPPTSRHTGNGYTAPTFTPDIKQEGFDGIPEFHPILTTDFFEYGTSVNGLENEGIAVEMGDAVLGLVAKEMEDNGLIPPKWVAIRNLSDPQINGDLDKTLGDSFAVWYYEKYGYWTSVMSALTTWAIIAGL